MSKPSPFYQPYEVPEEIKYTGPFAPTRSHKHTIKEASLDLEQVYFDLGIALQLLDANELDEAKDLVEATQNVIYTYLR